MWQIHFSSSACFSFHPHSPTESLTFAFSQAQPSRPSLNQGSGDHPHFCSLHTTSCFMWRDTDVIGLFCEELSSPRHKGASYSLCMFPSLLSTCPLAQYHSNYTYVLMNLINRSKFCGGSLWTAVIWLIQHLILETVSLEPHPTAAVQ